MQAYHTGARVHSNAWGCSGIRNECNYYSKFAEEIDKFVYQNPDFLPVTILLLHVSSCAWNGAQFAWLLLGLPFVYVVGLSAQVVAAGNNGPSGTVMAPATCELSLPAVTCL